VAVFFGLLGAKLLRQSFLYGIFFNELRQVSRERAYVKFPIPLFLVSLLEDYCGLNGRARR
jgi:hypothetical protein